MVTGEVVVAPGRALVVRLCEDATTRGTLCGFAHVLVRPASTDCSAVRRERVTVAVRPAWLAVGLEDSLVGPENAPCDTEQVRDVVEHRVWDLAGVYCLIAHHPVPVQRCVSPYSAAGVAAS